MPFLPATFSAHQDSLTLVLLWDPAVSASTSAAAFSLIDPFCSRLGPKEEVNMSSYSKRQVGASVTCSSLEKPVSPNLLTFLHFILKYSDLTMTLWISPSRYSVHTSLFPEFWTGCVGSDLRPGMQIFTLSFCLKTATKIVALDLPALQVALPGLLQPLWVIVPMCCVQCRNTTHQAVHLSAGLVKVGGLFLHCKQLQWPL